MKKILIIFALIFIGCFNQDPYYQSYCGSDCIQIPLLKPCMMMSTQGKEGQWYLSLCGKSSLEVSEFNVLDSIIISMYFNKHLINPSVKDTVWNIEIPSKDERYQFYSKTEFDIKVKTLTQKEIRLFPVDQKFEEFIENGSLIWFPDNIPK